MSVSRQRVGVVLCGALLCAALTPTAALAAAAKPSLSAPAANLVTMDGQQLWSHNRETRRRVASTIKMLNALVVRERASLDDTVTVSAKAARTADGVGLVKGQKLTVRKLLQMMLVASANDAAEALAIHIAGSEKKYVVLMNAKAKQLGLKDTHAIDPHGLSKREHSTARDLSVLARKVMDDPVLRRTVLLRKVVLYRPHHKPKTLVATDKLLGVYRGIEGVKTGFTNPAGYCFVSAAKRGNLELVSVVLGAGSLSGRFSQSRKLLDWGFARYRMRRIVSASTTMGVVQVSGGVTSSVTFHAARETSRAVIAAGPAVVSTVVMPETIPAPIKLGEQLGVVRVSQGGTVLASVALLADSSVATVSVPATVTTAPGASRMQSADTPQASTLWERLGGLPRRMLVALASTL